MKGHFMKRLAVIISGLLFIAIASPATAYEENKMYGKWYAGDWVSRAEDIDGLEIIYGLRMGAGMNLLGCIMYPAKNGTDRKLFGEITRMDTNDLEIRLSNGKEIELQKLGREPNQRIKFIRKVNGTRAEVEFVKEFLPSGCI
jgi:hypothetical protein